MKRSTIFFSFAFLVVGISARGLRPRIIDGSDAQIENFPYQASVRLGPSFHLCGGSIISQKHILTAAHCINLFMVPPFSLGTVHTGTSSSKRPGNSYKIANMSMHPEYKGIEDSSYRHDVAILTLEGEIIFDKYQKKIDLASKDIQSGAKANLTGWGRTEPDSETAAIQLQKLETMLLTNTECQPHYADYEIYEDQLCAFRSKGTGACRGDSGGPLVVDGEVVGIVSWVDEGNCAGGNPEVYTNVYSHRDYIKSVINK